MAQSNLKVSIVSYYVGHQETYIQVSNCYPLEYLFVMVPLVSHFREEDITGSWIPKLSPCIRMKILVDIIR